MALLGQARIYVVLGREWLLPSWFAYVHPKRETPIYAAAWTGLTAGAHRSLPPRPTHSSLLCTSLPASAHLHNLVIFTHLTHRASLCWTWGQTRGEKL